MLRPRWRKLLADLWGNKARTLLVVASIAVGTFAAGVIAGAYVLIPSDMNASYAASQPPNIKLVTDAFGPDLVDAVRGMDEIDRAEGRRIVQARLREPDGDWTSIEMHALADFDQIEIANLIPRDGSHEPQDHQALLATKTAERLGLAVGDTLEMELADGTRKVLPGVGIVQDLNTGIGGFLSGSIAYVTSGTLEWLHEPSSWNRLYATVAGDPNDVDTIREASEELTDRFERSGHMVYRSELLAKNKHPLGHIIKAVIGVLGLLGVLIVFLAGSLITNTLSALLTQHLRQIGVMKLIGARRPQIIGMYVSLILAYGMLALIVSVPTASWSAYALSKMVADLINFVLRPAALVPIIPAALALQTVIALGIPLLSALPPILRGSRITIQEAIHGGDNLGEQDADRWLDRSLAAMRTKSRPLIISIRNTFRRKARLALTLLTLTLGGAIFVAVFNSQVALDNKVYEIQRYFRADVNLDLSRPYRVDEVRQYAMAVPGVSEVEAWTSAQADLLLPDGSIDDTITLLAPPADSQLVTPIMLEGRWLTPGDQKAITVSDAFLKRDAGLAVGDWLRLGIDDREDDWQVVGVFQYTGTDDLIVYADYDVLSRWRRQPEQSAIYRVVTDEKGLANQERVAAALDQHFRDLGFQVRKVEAGDTFAASVTDILGVLNAVLVVLALLTALVGSIGLAGTLSMNVLERTREIGVMRAIGAHDRIVVRLVLVEGLLIGLISYALGALLSFPITQLLSNTISMAIFSSPADFAVTASGFGLWIAVVLVLSVLASIAPARSATRLTIREVLAYE